MTMTTRGRDEFLQGGAHVFLGAQVTGPRAGGVYSPDTFSLNLRRDLRETCVFQSVVNGFKTDELRTGVLVVCE